MLIEAIVTDWLTRQLAAPLLSKNTASLIPGTEDPPGPPEKLDQFRVLLQLPVEPAIQ